MQKLMTATIELMQFTITKLESFINFIPFASTTRMIWTTSYPDH